MDTNAAAATDCIIVVNCGSSSLKFALLPVNGGHSLLKGLAERLGTPDAVLKTERGGVGNETPMPGATHRDALQAAAGMMEGLRPRAIGHRVVHGGERFTGSVRIDDAVMAAIDRCACLAPLHNPANLTGVRTARELFPRSSAGGGVRHRVSPDTSGEGMDLCHPAELL